MTQSTFRKQDKTVPTTPYSCLTFRPETHSNKLELLVDSTQLSYQPVLFRGPREKAKEKVRQKGKARAKVREAANLPPRAKVRVQAFRLHPSLPLLDPTRVSHLNSLGLNQNPAVHPFVFDAKTRAFRCRMPP